MKTILFALLLLLIGCAPSPQVTQVPTQQDIDNDSCLFEIAVNHCKHAEFGVKYLKINDHKYVYVKCADTKVAVTLVCE